MRVAVVGSGYVGLVTGGCFADLGHEVLLVDNDEKKLEALRHGEVPIHEKFLPELLARHRGNRIKFSGDLQAATRASDAIFIAVGTPPTESGDADMSYVESVAREISGAIDGYKVIVEKSTVHVYTRMPNGDLAEFVNDGLNGRVWNAYDITAASAGPGLQGDAGAVAVGSLVEVFAERS